MNYHVVSEDLNVVSDISFSFVLPGCMEIEESNGSSRREETFLDVKKQICELGAKKISDS